MNNTSFYYSLYMNQFFLILIINEISVFCLIYFKLGEKIWGLILFALICVSYVIYFYYERYQSEFSNVNPFDVVLGLICLIFIIYEFPILIQQTKMIMMGLTLSQYYNILSFNKYRERTDNNNETKSIREIPSIKTLPTITLIHGFNNIIKMIISIRQDSLLYQTYNNFNEEEIEMTSSVS